MILFTLILPMIGLYMSCAAHAHIVLQEPKPYFATRLGEYNGPLPDAASYPCMWPTWSSYLNSEQNLPERTTIRVGVENTVKFKGTAVHNGGGCQFSITYDPIPLRNSTFKVFYSIEGGCPGMDDTAWAFNYTLPDSVPSGNAIFVWSWFPVSSGGKEMYMNCAPIKVVGGAEDDTEFSNLPDLFVANLANDDEFTCETQYNRVVAFPDPGNLFVNDSLIHREDKRGNLAAPTDKNTGGSCGTGGSTTTTPSQSAGGSTAVPTQRVSSDPAAGFGEVSVTTTPASTAKASSTTLPTTIATTSRYLGCYDEEPSSTFSSVPTTSTAVETRASTTIAAVTTRRTTSSVGTAGSSIFSSKVVSTGTKTTAASAPSGSSDGPCNTSNSGELVCNGASQWGICNWGSVVWQPVAPGTVCENGVIKGAKKIRNAGSMNDRRSRISSHRRQLSG